MKTIEQFYNEAKENIELQAAFAEAVKSNTVEAFLKEQQVDGTLEDVENYAKAHFKKGELSDEELEAVSGGYNWATCPDGEEHAKNVKYQFHVGDHVIAYLDWFFVTRVMKGQIKEIRPEYDEISMAYYPYYYVVEDGKSSPRHGWFPQDYLCYN